MPALVKEVILENFMSYKYARIPLAPGINVITGPNGSGKSSILLGFAVALGRYVAAAADDVPVGSNAT